MIKTYFSPAGKSGTQVKQATSFFRRSAFALAFALTALCANAQVSSYTFSQSAGTYTPITGTVLGTSTNDDNVFNALPIGFPVCFNGQTYTTFSVNANGFIVMGNTAVSSYTSLSTGTSNNVIAGFNNDLQGDAAGGSLEYATIGTSPNQTLVVQWTNYDRWPSGSNFDVYNFQIRISETTGLVEIVYGTFTTSQAFYTGQVGLRGNNNADFSNREVSNGINTWATSTAGGFNNSAAEINNTPLVPSSGQTYSWALPASAAAPTTVTFTSVGATAMTVNWVDNSTNEAGFLVERSLDNITYTPVTTVTSTSTATTGTPYNYNATGLFTNTLYYWRISGTTANCSNGSVVASQSTSPGTLCGTYTIGPTGAYPSLTAAIAAVQTNGILCPLVFELQAAYVSTVETFPIVVPFLGSGPGTSITVRPEAIALNLSISSNASQTIDFNGASYFTFDGRPGGVGTNKELTIENTANTGTAIRLINGTQNCGTNYMRVRGVNTSTINGVVVFSTASASSGNNNNTFTNSEFYDGLTTPNNLVYSSGTTTLPNTGNTFTDNLFYNWYSATSASNAINVATGNSAWVISNNSFYQTATRNYTTGTTHNGITINSTSANSNGYVITGNYVGGTAALCGGTPYTITGTVATRFVAINVTAAAGTASSVQGNTITNFSMATSSSTTTANGIWCGINITGTNNSVNVGTVTGNTIGSTTANGQIVTSTSGTGGMTVGINSSASGTVNIANNMIGGITANTSSGTVSSSIYGIQTTSGTVMITNNTVGSTTMTSSLINAASTGGTGGHVTGIFSSFTISNTVSGNTVRNITNQYAGTSTTGQVRGIVTTSGVNTVTGNTVMNLATMSPQTGTTTASSVLGISQQSTSAGQTVANNTVMNLGSGSLTGNVNLVGMYFTSSTLGSNNMHANNVGYIAAASGGAPVIHGIFIGGGVSMIYNNMVNLVVDALGASITNAHEFNGITKNTTSSNEFYYNTVSIGGTGVASGTANTSAFRRNLTGANDSVRYNIFVNVRSNATTGGSHYLVNLNNSTTIDSDGNDFWGNGTGFAFGISNATPYATHAAWVSGTSLDVNSVFFNPNFVSATNLHITAAPANAIESRGVLIPGITVDIDNDVRPGPVGSINGGGTAPDLGADEVDAFPITVDVGVVSLFLPSATGCHGASDSVTVTIRNLSSSQTLNFATDPVTVNVSAAGPNPQVFAPVVINTGTLAPLATMNVTVSTTYNMTAAGVYTFTASTSATADVLTSNDAMIPVNITVSGGTALAAQNVVCLGSSADLAVSGQTNGGSIQWQDSPDGITWTNIVGATNATYTALPPDTMFYRAVICGIHNSIQDTVNVVDVAPATTIGDTRCGPGTVSMSASGSGTLDWYDAPTGGTLVNSGTTYTPTVTSTDTFYVENTFESCGAPGAPVAPVCYPVFSSACTSADFINNFSTTGGTTNISNLATGCNGAGPSNTTFFPGQVVTVIPGGTFNLTAQSGASWSQGFRLWIDYNADGDFADPGEDVWASATSSTAPHTGSVTVPANTTPGAKRMRLMCRFATVPTSTDYCATTLSFGEVEEYTLQVCLLCTAPRTEVIATVTPAPPVTVTSALSTYCAGDTVLMVASSPNVDYDYTWSPPTGLNTTNGDSVLASNPLGNYTYFVDALDTATGCQERDTISFSVNQPPTVIASASPTVVCAGAPSQLTTDVNTIAFAIDTADTQNTNTTYPAPYGNWYWGSHHQMLVTAAELNAAGITAGPITGLSWEVLTLTATPLNNFQIRMMHTTQTSLVGFAPPGTQVFITPSYVPTLGVNVHNFSTPFVWNGTDNIIVETCFNNTSFTTNCVFAQVNKPYTATQYYFADASGVCGVLTPNGNSTMRPAMTFFAQSNTLNYAWSPAAGLSSTTSSDPIAMPPATTTYSVVVTDPATGCIASDTVLLSTLPTPAPSFGPDTIICSNQPIVLDGTSGTNYTYLWQDMSTNQTFTVNSFGNYYVAVTDTTNGCVGTDTILVGVNAAPNFSLGSDVTVCAGTQVTFSGPGGQYEYDWNTMDTTQSIVADTSGNYELLVTDTVNGCFNRDTVMLSVNPLPPVALGIDTAVCSANTPLTLSGPAGNYTYMWNDASTNQTLDVTATGTYYVTVTDTATTCFSGDTVVISVNQSPSVSLGNDTTFCSADGPIMLTAPNGPYNYMWSDASTGMTLTTNASGTYYVTVTDSVNGCPAMDTINVNVPVSPVVSLSDTTMCDTSYTLTGPAGAYSYMWSNSATTQSITVPSPGGSFTLTVTDTTSGCAMTDSATVAVNAPPVVVFSVQPTACTTDPSFVLTGTPAGGTFSGPGVTGNMFTASVAGTGTHMITYTYTDSNGCTGIATDEITVSPCVGVDEPFIAAGMNVFPNPNSGLFTLTIKDADYTELSVELMSVEGKVVYSDMASNVKGNYVKQLDLTQHSNGIYFLRVTANGETFIHKVVKND